ncbi:MAG: class I SAM-dependent methyltransferase [Bacteroidia bacterium]|nr:class I SAM-dependent methyltransferase [Bacteroidia bacterium]
MYSKTKSNVSYPENGNVLCFQIEDNSFWFKHRNNCIISVLKNYPPESEIFDIGGGNGFVAAELERNGFKTVLVDPGLNGVRNAGKRELPNIICSTLEDAGFKKECISAIGLFDVLEHIREDLDFLKNIRDVLKDKGMLYLSVPAYNFLWSEEDKISGHFRRYSKRTISNLLKSTGFKIEYCSHFFFFLPVPIFILKVLPYKLGLLKEENLIKNFTKDHKSKSKFINNFIEKLLNLELGFINSKKSILFGGSIIVAATKE